MFDPYEKWLGIRQEQRPIDYFQLLGLAPDETDAEAIRTAAKQRIAKISRHKEGPYAQACERLLKEIQQAQATLLTPAKRAAYEARRQPRDEKEDSAGEKKTNGSVQRANGKSARKKTGKAARRASSTKGARGLWIGLGVGGVAVLALVVGVLAFWLERSKKDTPAPVSQPMAAVSQPQPAAPTTEPKPPPEPPPPPADPEPAPKKEPAPAPPPPPPPPPVVSRPRMRKPRPVVAKLPVPEQAAQDRAAQALKVAYQADYARKKPEDHLALAAKLLQPGRENRADPAAWFTLLREARDAAVRAERPRLAMEAIEEIDRWFNLDAFALKLQTLNGILRDGSPDTARAVAKTALFQVEQAVDADRYDSALALLETAENALRKAKLDKQLPEIDAKRREVKAFQQTYTRVAAAQEKLRQTPDDAGANFLVGRHLCVFHGRWDEGLPLLAQGGKDDEAALARQDLTPPTDVKAQIAVGDGWWRMAKAEQGRAKRSLQERGMAWYELAQPVVEEPEKARLVERMEEVLAGAPRLTRLLPGSFYGRGTEDRILLLREGGGTMRSEEAVAQGLQWLALHQSPSGMWSNHEFNTIKKCNCTEQGQKFDVAGTAFGLLPFLGAGETPNRGRYAQNVRRGLGFLLLQQKPEGKFSDSMYENALATIALCEAYGITRDQRYFLPAQAAVQFITQAQHAEGSWGYSPGAKGDTSITGWQFSALKAGHYAGLSVPATTFARVGGFLDQVADTGGLGYGYNTRGAGRSTTAAGLLCREYLGWRPSHPSLLKAMTPLLDPQNFVSKDKPSIYYLFYATQLMHHAGGEAWESWNPRLRDLLIDMQDQGRESGHEHQKGSWSPRGDEYAMQGGRLMFTSLALLLLEVYYYNIPLHGFGSAVLQD